MSMTYFLIAYGVTFFLQNRAAPYILKLLPFDFLRELLSCTFCTSFHVGWGLWLFSAHVFEFVPFGIVGSMGVYFLSAIGYGFAIAAFCYAVDAGVRWLETRSV